MMSGAFPTNMGHSDTVENIYDLSSTHSMKRESAGVLLVRWLLFSGLFSAFVTILSMFPERYSPYYHPRNNCKKF